MEFILIYTTHKDENSADEITQKLLENNLIACANIFPIKSKYKWKGKIENKKEFVAILKTKKENWSRVMKLVEDIHEYEIPCIINLGEVRANTQYTNWIFQETR